MTSGTIPINPSDVALVEGRNLWLAMQYMIDTERGLAMLRGITEAELREVDRALWDALGTDPAERVAVLVRFRAMIKVFAARRLSNLLLNTGHHLLAPAVQVAARMRLNAGLGFNPVKFERALLAKAQTDTALAA
ncbi:MAG TPA: hypothetical protein VJ740_06715 [Hyphomicrobiaceae bacterium]|nr:hypothetical protein [Hyphomicrobiaceae bacterium]